MTSKLVIVCLVCVSFFAGNAVAQSASPRSSSPYSASAPLSLEAQPSVDLPIGASTQYFGPGATMNVALRYRPQFLHLPLFLRGAVSYSYSSLQANDSVSLSAGTLGLGVKIPILPRLGVEAFAEGGYYYGFLNSLKGAGGDGFASGGLGIDLDLTPAFELGLRGEYRYYYGLYQTVSLGMSTTIVLGGAPHSSYSPNAGSQLPRPLGGAAGLPSPPGSTPGDVQLASINVVPVFPVFYKYYDDHPIGTVAIHNAGRSAASGLTASVYIKKYMDDPKSVQIKTDLKPGATTTVDLFALFSDSVLSITEGTKAAAEITVDYTVNGRQYETKEIQTVEFLNRNAMTWDDNRRAAAFVTAKDPAILTFAKNVVGYIRSKQSASLDSELQTAMALHEALDLYGLNYVPDPTTPYVVFSKKKDAVDFLQFPRQTLQYKAGDCDDLSILYSAMLEAVGLNAAFITTPGHIFVAVETGLTPKEAKRSLLPPDQVIVRGNHVWIPVEITLRHQGFLKAWELGAKEWREANPAGQAGFYPIEQAWAVYQPVGLPGTSENLRIPSGDAVLAALDAQYRKYVDQGLFPRVSALQQEIRTTGSVQASNSLGVLYAQYGQLEKARRQFAQILSSRKDYAPALINLGNVFYLRQDWKSARGYYERANGVQPQNPRILLAIARVDQELEDFTGARHTYAELKASDPGLAAQYSYLALGGQNSGTSRAADVARERSSVVWEDQ